MYKENRETLEVSSILLEPAIIIALVLSVYIRTDNELKFEFDSLSQGEKDFINIYNLHFRNESFFVSALSDKIHSPFL